MSIDATAQLVDMALLGTVYDGPRTVEGALDAARIFCRPWLDPSDAFLALRLETGLRDQWFAMAGNDRPREGDRVAATASGRGQFEDQLCRPLRRACHQHYLLHEQLRLSFLEQLPIDRRAMLADQLRRERQRCLVCLGSRLETLDPGPEWRLMQERRRRMAEEAQALDHRLAALGLLA